MNSVLIAIFLFAYVAIRVLHGQSRAGNTFPYPLFFVIVKTCKGKIRGT